MGVCSLGWLDTCMGISPHRACLPIYTYVFVYIFVFVYLLTAKLIPGHPDSGLGILWFRV